MPAKFFEMDKLPTPDEARESILAHIRPLTAVETVPLAEAIGRALAQEARAQQPLPNFRRSTVDGYAVRAADLASSTPRLRVIGEGRMGQQTTFEVTPGTAALIHTGGMLPEGADAVIMLEETAAGDGEIEPQVQLKPGDNVIQIGEDVQQGDLLLAAGHVLRVQDIGGLLATGAASVAVMRRPRVAVFSTGDEVAAAGQPLTPGQIYDINGTTISVLARQAGAEVIRQAILPDGEQPLYEATRQALASGVDMLILSAGSSVSARDATPEVINRLGSPGIVIHGIATRPGKPTILGMLGAVPVLGLPGNPVSALVQFLLFGQPMLYALQGAAAPPLYLAEARLTATLGSVAGREDWLPVRLVPSPDGLLAEPIPFKSNLIFSLVKAGGLVKIPYELPGYEAGERVQVRLFS